MMAVRKFLFDALDPTSYDLSHLKGSLRPSSDFIQQLLEHLHMFGLQGDGHGHAAIIGGTWQYER